MCLDGPFSSVPSSSPRELPSKGRGLSFQAPASPIVLDNGSEGAERERDAWDEPKAVWRLITFPNGLTSNRAEGLGRC